MRIGERKGESTDYKAARDELLKAEIGLKNERERVAEMRRALALDGQVEDYVFKEGPADLDQDGPIVEVRLSELFEKPDKPLMIYQYMFGGAQANPCPMCTLWMDGFNGLARHLAEVANVALVAEAEIADFRALGRQRGWRGLRLVSSENTTFKADLNFENADKAQWPGVSVFVLKDGAVWHSYSASAIMSENEFRGLDMLNPLWNLLDLTPEGRGDWMPKMTY
ncbi:MAG: DUF899 family protein [Methyloligellaceae bacterium]